MGRQLCGHWNFQEILKYAWGLSGYFWWVQSGFQSGQTFWSCPSWLPITSHDWDHCKTKCIISFWRYESIYLKINTGKVVSGFGLWESWPSFTTSQSTPPSAPPTPPSTPPFTPTPPIPTPTPPLLLTRTVPENVFLSTGVDCVNWCWCVVTLLRLERDWDQCYDNSQPL